MILMLVGERLFEHAFFKYQISSDSDSIRRGARFVGVKI